MKKYGVQRKWQEMRGIDQSAGVVGGFLKFRRATMTLDDLKQVPLGFGASVFPPV